MENVELVTRTFDALQRRAYQDAVRGFHADAVWQNTAAFPGPRRCVGREAIVDFWETLIEDFDQGTGVQEVERLIGRGDTVIVGVHSSGLGKMSGVPVDVKWAAVIHVRDGGISQVEVHGDWANALKAVGLEE